MSKSLFVAAGLLLASVFVRPALAEDAIDAFVLSEMQAQKIPGVAIAIIRDGTPVRVQGYGLANIEHNVPVHADTIFQTGSVGKQFTAMAVMLLVEDGKLKLDESVRTYLPEAPESWSKIKIRNLLNHTSGIGTPNLDLQHEYSDEDLLHLFFAAPPDFPPGRRWEYSNTGYETLGIIVTRVAGEFYGDLLAKRVFAPLGMTTARVISDRDIVMNRSAGYDATPQGYKNQSYVSAALNRTADGSLYLTALDYVKWDAGLRRHALLKQASSWKEIVRPAPLDNGTTYPYGFGWGLEKGPGDQLVWDHGGAWQAFRTHIRRYESDGVTFVALANSSSARPNVIVAGIAARYDARYAPPPAKPVSDAKPALGDTLAKLLERLTAGNVTAADFPQIPAKRVDETIARYRSLLGTLGNCGHPALYRDRPNGDRDSRTYRSSCSAGKVLQADAIFDTAGAVQNLRLSAVDSADIPF